MVGWQLKGRGICGGPGQNFDCFWHCILRDSFWLQAPDFVSKTTLNWQTKTQAYPSGMRFPNGQKMCLGVFNSKIMHIKFVLDLLSDSEVLERIRLFRYQFSCISKTYLLGCSCSSGQNMVPVITGHLFLTPASMDKVWTRVTLAGRDTGRWSSHCDSCQLACDAKSISLVLHWPGLLQIEKYSSLDTRRYPTQDSAQCSFTL